MNQPRDRKGRFQASDRECSKNECENTPIYRVTTVNVMEQVVSSDVIIQKRNITVCSDCYDEIKTWNANDSDRYMNMSPIE